jgi:hypothetical protein
MTRWCRWSGKTLGSGRALEQRTDRVPKRGSLVPPIGDVALLGAVI